MSLVLPDFLLFDHVFWGSPRSFWWFAPSRQWSLELKVATLGTRRLIGCHLGTGDFFLRSNDPEMLQKWCFCVFLGAAECRNTLSALIVDS